MSAGPQDVLTTVRKRLELVINETEDAELTAMLRTAMSELDALAPRDAEQLNTLWELCACLEEWTETEWAKKRAFSLYKRTMDILPKLKVMLDVAQPRPEAQSDAKPVRETPSGHSLGLAAQAWCEPETSHKEMDVALCTAFARILDRAIAQSDAEQGWTIAARAATERDELKLRVAELERALAQSDAEPVAWQWRMPNQDWPELSCGKAHAEYMRDKGAEIRPVFAAPPRPDASAEPVVWRDF